MSEGEADGAAEQEMYKRVWHGAVPILLELSPEVTHVTIEPLFVLAPRMGYLPLLANQIRDHFAAAIVPDDDNRLWLEYDGKPIRWHYPTGVLYDSANSAAQEPELPWRMVVRFQNFPQDELMSCHDQDACRQVFFNALKEATFLKDGNVNSIMSLPLDEQDTLWNALMGLSLQDGTGGILGPDVESMGIDFRRVIASLQEGSQMDRVPVKLHTDGRTLLKPQPSLNSSGQASSIADVLQSIGREDSECRIQGIVVPTCTAVEALYKGFTSLDQFLHIVV